MLSVRIEGTVYDRHNGAEELSHLGANYTVMHRCRVAVDGSCAIEISPVG